MAKMVRDRKSGKLRRVNLKRSAIAKKAARKRKGKHESAAVRRKISKSVRRAKVTGKTKSGRRTIKRR